MGRIEFSERIEHAAGGFQPVAVAVEPAEQRAVATPVGGGAAIAVHERHELIAGDHEFEQRGSVAVPELPDVSFVGYRIGQPPESEPSPGARSARPGRPGR